MNSGHPTVNEFVSQWHCPKLSTTHDSDALEAGVQEHGVPSALRRRLPTDGAHFASMV